MQSVRFPNGRGGTLAGDLYDADRDSVVVFAHGFGSERTSNGRLGPLAEALVAEGLACLAFDFAGCGDSDDDSLTATKQEQDLRAAIAYVQARGFRRIGLYGHSLGTLICLRVYTADIVTMVLSGALTGPIQYDWTQYYSPDQLQELAATGRLHTPPRLGPRKEIVIEARMLRDFQEIDQRALLTNVKCPMLIIHGDAEEEERRLLQISRTGLSYFPPGSRIEVIPGAGHGFYEHLPVLNEKIRRWFVEYLRA